MDDVLYKEIYENQGTHWFFLAKKRFFSVLLGNMPGAGSVVDVGCGTGALITYLGVFGKVTAVDISPVALSYAGEVIKDNTAKLVYGEGSHLPLKDGSAGLVCLSDVLYHKNVENDTRVIAECYRVLRPGGVFIMSDSAFKILSGGHDAVAHAARRYTRRDIRTKLETAGFTVKRDSYTYMTLFPLLVFAVRMIKRVMRHTGKAEAAEFKRASKFVNGFLSIVLWVEAQILRVTDLPFGVSVMAVAVKK